MQESEAVVNAKAMSREELEEAYACLLSESETRQDLLNTFELLAGAFFAIIEKEGANAPLIAWALRRSPEAVKRVTQDLGNALKMRNLAENTAQE